MLLDDKMAQLVIMRSRKSSEHLGILILSIRIVDGIM